ncbi:uncharacterized protein [Littorina saxatilis]|uniref:FERM domain-containing protein n=1 Tax=Littorina saxatilis TaxID=31220 RepID=A0AAN9GAE3_9CAEN
MVEKNSEKKSPKKMGDKSPPKEQPKQRTGKGFTYEVVLLDGEHVNFELDKNADGRELLEKVCQHLDLQEKDYFGLQYVDERLPHHLKCWLSPEKKISKQKKRGPWLFDFALKFYPPDPTQLRESLTRWLVTLQVRRDILSGKLPATFLTQAMLGSYCVQADVGDYDPNEHHGIEYVKDIPFSPNQTTELLEKIVELHKQHKGQTPDEAEQNFLENAKKLSMYGVDLHQAEDANNVELMLGVCASGLQVYREKLRISRFVWPKILKISYKRRHFYIKVRPSDNAPQENTVSFRLKSHRLAKRLWKICVEHHAFFRLREAEQNQNSAMFPRLGSKFRYSGRTLYQARHTSQILDRPDPYFERSQPARSTYAAPTNRSRSVDELSNRPGWNDDIDVEKRRPSESGREGRDKRDHMGQPTPLSQIGLPAGMKPVENETGNELEPGSDGKDRQDRKRGEDDATETNRRPGDDTMGLTPAELQKKAKEDEKERKKREKEEEKRRKKEEEERKKAEKLAKKGKGKVLDPTAEDRRDHMGGGDNTERLPGRTSGTYGDQEGGPMRLSATAPLGSIAPDDKDKNKDRDPRSPGYDGADRDRWAPGKDGYDPERGRWSPGRGWVGEGGDRFAPGRDVDKEGWSPTKDGEGRDLFSEPGRDLDHGGPGRGRDDKDRYGPGGYGDRYRPGTDGDKDRYGPGKDGDKDRYGPGGDGDRYGPGKDGDKDRYGPDGDRYGPGKDGDKDRWGPGRDGEDRDRYGPGKDGDRERLGSGYDDKGRLSPGEGKDRWGPGAGGKDGERSPGREGEDGRRLAPGDEGYEEDLARFGPGFARVGSGSENDKDGKDKDGKDKKGKKGSKKGRKGSDKDDDKDKSRKGSEKDDDKDGKDKKDKKEKKGGGLFSKFKKPKDSKSKLHEDEAGAHPEHGSLGDQDHQGGGAGGHSDAPDAAGKEKKPHKDKSKRASLIASLCPGQSPSKKDARKSSASSEEGIDAAGKALASNAPNTQSAPGYGGPGYGGPGSVPGMGLGAGDMSMAGVGGEEKWIDNKMRFEPIVPAKKETKDSLTSGEDGIDHTMPFFSPAATSTFGRPGKVPPPVPPKHNSYVGDDSFSRTDVPPTVATESVQYQPDLEEVPVPTKNVPIVKTETRTVTYERDGFPFDSEDDGVLVSASSHSTRMQTIETMTYKTEKDGIQETRVEHKVVLSSTDDDFDYDAALAEAIRSVTEFNPDMSVERIECVQQIEDVKDK